MRVVGPKPLLFSELSLNKTAVKILSFSPLQNIPQKSSRNINKNTNMNKKNVSLPRQFKAALLSLAAHSTLSVIKISAQAPPQTVPQTEDYALWYALLAVLALGLAGAVMWLMKSKKVSQEADLKAKSAEAKNAYDRNSLDADKEMEWLRKNQKLVGKKDSPAAKKQKPDRNARVNANLSKVSENLQEITSNIKERSPEPELPTVEKEEIYLPVFSIRRLELASTFDELPISSDDSLMDAIEQTYDELEEDSEVRELAVRILAAFKTRNSVEALTQVALYDLLANLRSKAVTVLCEVDHESVFEPILLACADPTREVRAAAARGLTKLTFDRADAWARIAELDEEGRVVSAARAAIESGFVEMSFERLVHQDRKYAYEAFALMALLIKAGETEKIFATLENHRDLNVRKAVLHVIKVTKDPEAVEGLYELLEKGNLPIEFQEEIDKTIEEIGYVTA